MKKELIGCNLRPGFKPGGFSENFSGNSRNQDRRIWGERVNQREAEQYYRTHYTEVVEAASVVLQGRQMPRAEENGHAPL